MFGFEHNMFYSYIFSCCIYPVYLHIDARAHVYTPFGTACEHPFALPEGEQRLLADGYKKWSVSVLIRSMNCLRTPA